MQCLGFRVARPGRKTGSWSRSGCRAVVVCPCGAETGLGLDWGAFGVVGDGGRMGDEKGGSGTECRGLGLDRVWG